MSDGWQPRGDGPARVLVLGGTSEIALAIVRALAARGPCEVALLGRDRERLAAAAAAVGEDGRSQARCYELDAGERERHEAVIGRAVDEMGGVDLAVLAVGLLGGSREGPDDVASALRVMDVNFLGAGSLLLHTAARMRDAGFGTIVVLSSVAGERPRRANAVYGSSKAGLDGLAASLGYELEDAGVRVLVVRPGFVHTRMTRGLEPAPFATSADAVAGRVLDGLDSGAHTVWAPAVVRWPMLAMRLLPRSLFRRLRR
jgi:decaprenylphospho-beta-D-erythro-pentofuranosid-2-ulose 2-reductase